MTAEKNLFGQHIGKELRKIPSGYLRWLVEDFDHKPLPKVMAGMSIEEIQAKEDPMQNLFREAADELDQRGSIDQT